ncbi:MAG: hypothetical protein AMXMBFR53_27990 [Gemmatimonadota bacterium]
MPDQYILLPRRGLVSSAGAAASVLTALPRARSTSAPIEALIAVPDQPKRPIRVLDSIQENGPKLVELDGGVARSINDPRSPVRALPLVTYARPEPRRSPAGSGQSGPTTTPVSMRVTVRDAVTAAGVPGATVVAFTDFANGLGAQGLSDANGDVHLTLFASTVERLYCYSPPGYWGAFRTLLPLASLVLDVTPVDLSWTDGVRHYYGGSRFDPATGVTVGVIDTGVGPHAQLNVVGGRNTVTGEPATDWRDGDTHGTHVAGLIGAGGAPPTGLRGLAPGIPMHAYRVFPVGKGATNYAILKAMIMAAADGCDIINLSLGGGPYDEIVEESIADARNQGMLVVVAAGNDNRATVSYPAAHLGATGISAIGVEGTFPTGSLEEADVQRPPASSSDPNEFVAAFSNVGSGIDVTGPGVGALSTLPNNQFGPMSGTSMAAPVVTGATACLLSRDAPTYNMPRDRARSDAIEQLLQSSCVRRGFGMRFEGYGLPDPGLV